MAQQMPWETDYSGQSGKMPWETDYSAVAAPETALPWYTPITSAPVNLKDAIVNAATAIRHPLDTYNGLGNIVQGEGNKLEHFRPQWMHDFAKYVNDSPLTQALGQQGTPQTPDEIQQQDDAASGLDANIAHATSSLPAFWNTVATHPVDTLMMAAPGLGMAGKVADVAGAARTANVLAKTSRYTNPVNWGPSQLAGYGVDTVAPKIAGLPRTTSTLLRGALPADTSQFAKMGPEAMLLDASPSTVGLAQGVTVGPGAAKNDIVTKLAARDTGRTQRLQEDVTKAIGGSYDPAILKKSIDRGIRKQAGPIYKAAIQNAPPLGSDTSDILARKLTNPSKSRALEARGVMGDTMSQIDDALAADTPAMVTKRLHSVRQQLDSKIVYDKTAVDNLSSADKAAQGTLKQARSTVDGILKSNVPGFERADKIAATGNKAKAAIDYGYDNLDGGKSAIHPETNAKNLKGMDPRMVREGIKARISNAVGTSSNDLAALKKMIGGEADWNRDKLAASFGQPSVDKMVGSVGREQQFSQNYADIARNSQTAQRSAGAATVGKPLIPDISQSASLAGLPAHMLVSAVNKLLSRGVSRFSDANGEALAKALALRGPAAQRMINDLVHRRNTTPTKFTGKAIIRALIAGQSGGYATGTQ